MKKKILSFLIMTVISVVTIGSVSNASAATFKGPCSISTLTYVGGHGIYWSVQPATNWLYEFIGTVKFGGKSFGSESCGPVNGILGSEVDGTVISPVAGGKGTCTATLTGTAYAVNGSQFTVVPTAHIGF